MIRSANSFLSVEHPNDIEHWLHAIATAIPVVNVNRLASQFSIPAALGNRSNQVAHTAPYESPNKNASQFLTDWHHAMGDFYLESLDV